MLKGAPVPASPPLRWGCTHIPPVCPVRVALYPLGRRRFVLGERSVSCKEIESRMRGIIGGKFLHHPGNEAVAGI